MWQKCQNHFKDNDISPEQSHIPQLSADHHCYLTTVWFPVSEVTIREEAAAPPSVLPPVDAAPPPESLNTNTHLPSAEPTQVTVSELRCSQTCTELWRGCVRQHKSQWLWTFPCQPPSKVSGACPSERDHFTRQ